MTARRSLDPRWRVLYLVTVAVGVFALRHPWQTALLVAVQAALWLAVGLGPRRLLRQIMKLWGFALFIVVSFALTSEDPAIDRWITLRAGAWELPLKLNVTGAILGLLMVMRVLAVVLASQIARADVVPNSSSTLVCPAATPKIACPPLRPEAPQAMRCASRSATR